jgi:hypothetical protein
MIPLFIDRKSKIARIWSNVELKKFAHLFKGSVVNVSAWKDFDKEGTFYKDYFTNASSYSLTNYKEDARGFQGKENEIFLDLEQILPKKLERKYDTVFNHTTLEHIFDFQTAFKNICLLANDTVILVVPFLQHMHSTYGDYWRFTPLALKNMFEQQGFKIMYLSFNNQRHAAVYIFVIASRQPEKWKGIINGRFNYRCKNDFLDFSENFVGCRAITNSIAYKLYDVGRIVVRHLRKLRR